MFNGDFRSKRQINLGGTRGRPRNSGRRGNNDNTRRNKRLIRPTDKASLLEEARKQREERKIVQKQKDSCCLIQQSWRGFYERKLLVNHYIKMIFKDENKNKVDSTISVDMSLEYVWKVIGILLSPALSCFLPFDINTVMGHKVQEKMNNKTKNSKMIESTLFLMHKVFVYLHGDKYAYKPPIDSFASIRIAYSALYLMRQDDVCNGTKLENFQNYLQEQNTSTKKQTEFSYSLIEIVMTLFQINSNQIQFQNQQLHQKTHTFDLIYHVLPSLLLSLQHHISNDSLCLITQNLLQITFQTLLFHPNKNHARNDINNTSHDYHLACIAAILFCKYGTMTPELLHKMLTQTISQMNMSYTNNLRMQSLIRIVNEVDEKSVKEIQNWAKQTLLSPLAYFLSLEQFHTTKDKQYDFDIRSDSLCYRTLSSDSLYQTYPSSLALLKHTVNLKELNLLSNALLFLSTENNNIVYDNVGMKDNVKEEYSSSQILVQLLHHAILKCPEFSTLTSIVASGTELNEFQNEKRKSMGKEEDLTNGSNSSHDDYDDDYYDDDFEEMMTNTTTSESRSNKETNNHRSIRRNQEVYITIARLDKLFSQYITTQQDRHIASNPIIIRQLQFDVSTASLSYLATKFGKSKLLLHVGNSIFSHSFVEGMNKTRLEQMYCTILARILKGNCNSINRRTSIAYNSHFLANMTLGGSKSQAFMNHLWMYIRDFHDSHPDCYSYTKVDSMDADKEIHPASIVFCEIFFYFLFSKDDEEFLKLYTVESIENNSIVAKDVISWLRDLLQNLYWIKPVSSTSIETGSSGPTQYEEDKIRLLLSGTKLYNALYERWCRLHKTYMFCEESLWWFPQHSRVIGKVKDSNQVVVTEENIDFDMDQDDDVSMDERENHEKEDESSELASSFRDTKIARLLTSIPQALPFHRRVTLFDSLLKASKDITQNEVLSIRDILTENPTRKLFIIRRDNLFHDSMEQLNREGSSLKGKVQIKFVNEHGMEEAGVDGGGVFKEFLDDLVREAFRPNRDVALFEVSDLETLYVSPGTTHLQSHYTFLGRVLGKAVYESILVEPQFCTPFLNTLLGKQNSLDDLKNLDPIFYRHLKELRLLSEDEIANLGLSFEVTISKGKTVELLPNGSKIALRKENLLQYIHLVSHYKLNIQGAMQTRAFLRGFRDLVPTPWLRLFSSYELQKLISGDDTIQGIDVQALRETVVYAGGYHPSQPIIQWFWELLLEFSPEKQRLFLKFMTSCSRQPLMGFASLTPVPCIRQVRLSDQEDDHNERNIKLPTSSTCMNLLKLPNYGTKELLKEKLLYAIESGAGFELS